MKTKSKIKILFFVALLVFTIFQINHVKAQTTNPGAKEYTPLVPLPGGDPNQSTLVDYLPRAFNLIVGIAVALAFVMITFGGITYATSDAITAKDQGKQYIQNALWGLLLVIASYTILYTINPQILNFNLSLKQTVVQGPDDTVYVPTADRNTYTNGILNGYVLTKEEVAQNDQIREMLRQAGVLVNAGACANGGTHGCTNVVLLPSTALTNVMTLKSACNQAPTLRATGCAVIITGGTEGGHSDHGPGKPVIDLSPTESLNTYLATINKQALNPYSKLKINIPGGTATYENTGDNGRASAPHWHVEY